MDVESTMQPRRHTAPNKIVTLIANIFLLAPCLAETGWHRSPISVAVSPDGGSLYVAEATADQITILDIPSEKAIARIRVAHRPIGLAISSDGTTLYVTSTTAKGTVQIVDIAAREIVKGIPVEHTPVALVPSRDGTVLYVCNRFNNSIGIVDLATRHQTATIPVPREPVAAALSLDDRHLFVANHLPAGPANTNYTAATVSVIDVVAGRVIKNIELPDGSTNLQGIAMSPDGQHAYVTHILARYKFPTTYLERAWVSTNAMTIVDVPSQRYVNTVLLDDPGLGAANPHGIVCTADGRSIVISHTGTHELSVIDRAGLHDRLLPARSPRDFVSASTSTSGRSYTDPAYAAADIPNDLTFMAGIRRRLKLAGNGPRGLALIGAHAYTAEYFSDSIGIVDIDSAAQATSRSIPLGAEAAMTTARRGEMLFHDATRSYQAWHSCASCHANGARAGALNWDLLNDGMLNAKNTKSLLLTHQTPPAMVTGVRANAETAVQSGIYYIQFAVPRRSVTEPLNAYLKSLEPVPSPYLVNGQMGNAARRGERIFKSAGCARCHAGPHYTDGLRHRVGTATEEEPRGRFDTPTLIELWRTAPYLHDGRATTVRNVLTTFNPDDRHGRISTLTEEELSDLIEFVLTR